MTVVHIAGLLSFSGCYSFSATTLPDHIRTVRIADVENLTPDPALGIRLHQGIVDLFRREASGVRILTQDDAEADAEFSIALIHYSNRPDNFSRDASVETYRATLGVRVRFYDLKKKHMLYQSDDLRADGIYDVLKNETEEDHGQRRALEKLQELIITNALSRW